MKNCVIVLFRSRNIWEHASAILKVLALSRDPKSGVIRLEVFSQFTTEVKQSILTFSETGKISSKMIKILGKNVTCSKILLVRDCLRWGRNIVSESSVRSYFSKLVPSEGRLWDTMESDAESEWLKASQRFLLWLSIALHSVWEFCSQLLCQTCAEWRKTMRHYD